MAAAVGRVGASLRVTALLVGLSILPATPACANVGVPILGVLWPAMWLLLAVIIPLEAWVATRILGKPLDWSLGLAVHANLVSTALGLPAVWGLPALGGFQDLFLGGIARSYGVPVSDGHYTRLALASAALLCLPCYLASVGSEYWVARRAVEAPLRRRAWRWAWTANTLSYVLVFALAALYFQSVIPSWYRKVWAATCLSNLKIIALSIQEYERAHNDRLPRATDFATLVPIIRPALSRKLGSSVREENQLCCPATGKRYLFNTALSGMTVSSIPRPDEVPLLIDAKPHDRTVFMAVFADGHTRGFRPDEGDAKIRTFR
jgi:hypothetical protein